MNKAIQKYLKSNSKDFFAGVALYEKYDLEAPLKVKFITKGATDFNKNLLKSELERLAKIDPQVIEEKRKEIAKELEAKKEAKKLADEEAEKLAREEAERLEQEEANNSEQEKSNKQAIEALQETIVEQSEELETLKQLPEAINKLKEANAKLTEMYDTLSKTVISLRLEVEKLNPTDKGKDSKKVKENK